MGEPGAVDVSRRFGHLVPTEGAELPAALPEGPLDLSDDGALRTFLAVARESAEATVGLRPYQVQLLAAAAMLRGTSVEMATGEGKTLVGAIVAAGLARSGRRVHVLSVNDYLAGRDAAWMGPLLAGLGVTGAAVTSTDAPTTRRASYLADVVYVPVAEAGFDLLRDRICLDPSERVRAAAGAVVVDEADAVLIDEACLPLVLADHAPGEHLAPSAEVTDFVAGLVPGLDHEADEDRRTVTLSDEGLAKVEAHWPEADLFGADAHLLTSLNVALYAHALLVRDVDYLVRDGRVQIVNQARGRLAALQRWPEGLQAAVEAKEGLDPSAGAMVLDQILVQELIGTYDSVVGMSGTLVGVAHDLAELYGIAVGPVPTHQPCIRDDRADLVHASEEDRNATAVALVTETIEQGRPVLVATQSVAESERFADLLREAGLDPAVLNARNDAVEAALIARAGEPGRLTVSTQMAGRGTDIRLDPASYEAGGLMVVGLGRFPSERLDRQLRGRAGRQGDPGTSVFVTSLEDDLVVRGDPPSSGLPQRRWHEAVDHAQRVAEGQHASLLRLTKRYQRRLGEQRGWVLKQREGALAQPAGPERTAMLLALDEAWQEHLSYATGLREGIHLQALGRQTPSDVFDDLVATTFASFAADVTARRDELLADGLSDEQLRERRPAATWTYLVTDDTFGSEWERMGATLFSRARR